MSPYGATPTVQVRFGGCVSSNAPTAPNRRISRPFGRVVLRYFDRLACGLSCSTLAVCMQRCPPRPTYWPPLRLGCVAVAPLLHGRNTGAIYTRLPSALTVRLFWDKKKTTHSCTVRSRKSLSAPKTPFRGRWLSISGASAFLTLIINEKMFSVKNDFSELVFGTRTYHNM